VTECNIMWQGRCWSYY